MSPTVRPPATGRSPDDPARHPLRPRPRGPDDRPGPADGPDQHRPGAAPDAGRGRRGAREARPAVAGPAAALAGAVAAVLRRRDARAAAAARREPGPPRSYELPAARLLLARGDLAPLVPQALRRRVRAERRAALAAAAERVRRRAGRGRTGAAPRRAGASAGRAALRRRGRAAVLRGLPDGRRRGAVRWIGHRRRAPPTTTRPSSPRSWRSGPTPSFPGGAPAWWRPPPGMLARMRERTDPWIDGRTREVPDGRDLVPADVDLTKPWPWRAEPGDA